MHKDFFYELMKYKPKVFSAIVQEFLSTPKALPKTEELHFLLDKEDQKHDIFFNAETLLSNKKIEAFLFPDKSDFSWDYSDERSHIALISSKDMYLLALYFGTAINAKEIAHILEREKVLSLKNELSPELYTFAIERGQFLFSSVCKLFTTLAKEVALGTRIKLHGRIALEVMSEHWSQVQKEKIPLFSEEIANLNLDFSSFMPQFTENEKQSIYTALKKIFNLEVGDTYV